MRLSYIFVVLAVLVSSAVYAADEGALSVVTDRTNALYKCGEEAVFIVSVQSNLAGEIAYRLTLDGATRLAEGKLISGGKPLEIKGKLDSPGILQCAVTVSNYPKTILAAAAFDPEQIKPSATEPADFKTFWDQKKRELAAVPVDAQLTEMPRYSDANVTVYKVRMNNVSNAYVYGWLGVPKKKGPFPAIITVPCAGVGTAAVGWTSWARSGFLSLGLGIHDIDPEMPEEKLKQLEKNELANYQKQGMQSRDTYYFLRVFLGCVRAVDYLASRPDWDGKHIVVRGWSQGGALSIITAGLDQRVSAIAPEVPALCDHAGCLHGRPSGWPQLIVKGDPVVAQVSAYYDAVNFARYAKCETIMVVGLIDTVCPPMTVYAAYNVLAGPKRMLAAPLRGHAPADEKFQAERNNFISSHVRGH